MARVAALLISLALAGSLVAPVVAGDSGGAKPRRFFSARHGVGVEAPSGWSLSLHTGYANILCALLHPGGSRISLAVDRTLAKNAAALAGESRPGLASQGLTVDRAAPGPRDGFLVEAKSARGEHALRQLYWVRPVEGTRDERQAIVLTLTTSVADLPAATSAFDWVVAHLTLEMPARPDEKPDGGR